MRERIQNGCISICSPPRYSASKKKGKKKLEVVARRASCRNSAKIAKEAARVCILFREKKKTCERLERNRIDLKTPGLRRFRYFAKRK